RTPPRPREPSRCTSADPAGRAGGPGRRAGPAGRAGVLVLRTWIATGYGTRFGRGTETLATAPARVYYKLLGVVPTEVGYAAGWWVALQRGVAAVMIIGVEEGGELCEAL